MMPSIVWMIFAPPFLPARGPVSLLEFSPFAGCGGPGWLGVKVLHHPRPPPPYHRRTVILGSAVPSQASSSCLQKFGCGWLTSVGAAAMGIYEAAVVDWWILRIRPRSVKEALVLVLAPHLTRVRMPQVAASKRWSVIEPRKGLRALRHSRSRLSSSSQRPRRRMGLKFLPLSVWALPQLCDPPHNPASSGCLARYLQNCVPGVVRD